MPRKLKPAIVWISDLPYVRCTYGGVRKPRAIYTDTGERVRSPQGARAELIRVNDALAANENPWPESQTFESWLSGYLRSCKLDDGNAPRTLAEKEKTIGYFVAWVRARGVSSVSDVSFKLAQTYLQELQELKSSRWRNLCRNYLSHAFKWAELNGMIAQNPFALSSSIKPVTSPKPTVATDELNAVIKAALPHNRLMLRFAFYTGVRPGELCALKWSSVHLDHRYADIADLKGKKSRPVTFPDSIADELRALRGGLGVCAFLRGVELKNGPVFVTQRGSSYNTTTWYHAVKKACLRAHVPRFNPHRLRHTAITEMIRRGADLIAVRDAAGHHSISVTNLYSHSNPVTVRRAFDVLPDLEADNVRSLPQRKGKQKAPTP